MNDSVKDWLPRDAFGDDAVKAALSGPVARWSERWFAQGAAAIAAVQRGPGAPSQGQVFAGAVADAELPGRGKRHLLEAALDVDLTREAPGEGDHRVLDGVAVRIVEDLLAVLGETFGADATGRDAGTIRVTLSLGDNDILAVTLAEHVLVPALKARLGAVRKTSGTPGSRIAALAPLRLVAQGVLGRADLALEDLHGLSAGDVVVLDRALNEAVELRLAAGGERIGRGRLGRSGGQVTIRVLSNKNSVFAGTVFFERAEQCQVA